MATATLTRPTAKTKTRKPSPPLRITKTENKDVCRVTRICTTCDPKLSEDKKKKKKKPMRKLGCWRGAFKGTLDF